MMCGIAGIIGLHADARTVAGMLRTMQRRGPDGSGTAEIENGCLLHSRLAVIDPEKGKQPMELDWRGQKFTLVYNGELYNTEELRRQLMAMGHDFLTRSDTEVVLHAYAEFGADCVAHMNGIYAFAVWESGTKRLFLARDRIGVKPLFYKIHQNGFYKNICC